ncbi:type II CRISPR RNA-guided endonuclease Cas9 [Bacteroides nordii]|uniref:type II CRISPR RNA-guided endonuclease Cas9 n=1 Tax=Bacteroides nordii TaxID=291645 RepID=UPI0018A04CF4|nr:type II CRISPR RNA-guided endonuclease Cas9 [Bacteroides nordii]
MKNILGLDLGTNSIGWAVINSEEDGPIVKKRIELAGSRIIPMDAAVLGNFDSGVTKSQTAERTSFRSIRRLRERQLLRRERLHKVLQILGFLPEHYVNDIDFENHPGKIKRNTEPKLPWRKNSMGQFEFIFQDSFEAMLTDFATHQPVFVSEGKKVPYDWTLYYLRKKALTEGISKEELAWLILNFNQKRGYYQLRGEEEEEQSNKLVEFYALRVVKVEATDDKKGKDTWYNVHLENGWIYRRTSNIPLDWEGKVKEFIVTTDLNEDGTPKLDKYGEVKRSFRAPKEDDWTLIKKKTESDIANSHKTVGCYIYDALLQNPHQKIKGRLVRTVERKFYKEELRLILEKQLSFHPELQDRDLYRACIDALYVSNEAHKNNISGRDFVYLFIDDIIFYQRPLKTKKSLIDNCPYEENQYMDRETGEVKQAPIKCIAKSHPLFQEFRLWQFISNIRIYQRERVLDDGKLETDVDVTPDFLKTEDDYTTLFEWFNDRKEVDQKAFLKNPQFGLKKTFTEYRWNYVEDKSYPCNETRNAILNGLQKAGVSADFLSREVEEALWHILYSVEDKIEIESALRKFASKHDLDDRFADVFKKLPPFKKEYGAYSAKAIKKLLPLMRIGKYWELSNIDDKTKERIDKIITGEWDENIHDRVREKAIKLSDITDFKGLPLWLSCYVVYNRHFEARAIAKWESPEDIDSYLRLFRQHSLRNPIVEQVITETLRTVRDIWKRVGQIDEIHVELGREIKNPADKRAKMTAQIVENENTNLRIKALLAEFINSEYEIENVRPYSSNQQEKLKIYEDTVLNGVKEIPEDINTILKKFRESDLKKRPTKSDFLHYKLWLEQKYCSPYTGRIIPLGKLFTSAYEIEHIIPQAHYFDDSFSNKVICEAEVNGLKDKKLGYEFIKHNPGKMVEIGFGKPPVRIFSVEEYERFVKENYSGIKNKMNKLLMDDMPETFIERQLNDSRYISKVVKSLLSNIVREKDSNGEYEPEAISKNVIVCTGSVTDRLKRDWGVNDVWNSIIYPRFERLNELTGSQQFGCWENKEGKRVFQTAVPLEMQKGFSKKRIDHRHHAMDAIIIACATRNHINYLSNESASKKAKISRTDLQRLLCTKCRTDDNGNYKWIVKKPWPAFTQDIRKALENITVSFKQNLRVINKTTNYYVHFDESGKKVLEKQINGDSWAIRKPMHKDTVFGKVNLQKVKEVRLSLALDTPKMIVDKKLKEKVLQLYSYKYDKKRIDKYFKENASLWKDLNLSKVAVYYFTNDSTEPLVAVRKPLDTSFNAKKIKESVTDTGIQKILLNHLSNNQDNPNLAFSPDGIDEMNKNLTTLNDGKYHQPIYKVRVCEPQGNKFSVGTSGNKTSKYVEAAKGTNLFFAVYQTEDGKRNYETIPLNVVIEREKLGWTPVPENNNNGDKLLFWLSPNDLVYVPTADELNNGMRLDNMDKGRIYKMISCSGPQCFFIPQNVSNAIIPVIELGANNKAEKSWNNEMIKAVCVPIRVDRLGCIT